MKRNVIALCVAAGLVGCQSSPKSAFDTHGYTQGGAANGFSQTARPNARGAVIPSMSEEGAAKDNKIQLASYNEVVPAGYNDGYGQMRNNIYKQKVAAAMPSPGAAIPGGGGIYPPGGMDGMSAMMGGPGMMGGMGGMGGPGGGGCPPGMDGGMGPGMGMGLAPRFIAGRSQIRFVNPQGMLVAWQTGMGEGFSPPQLQAPARYNFAQARIYRLKLTNIPNRAGLTLYPTLEVYPGNAKLDAFLAHNAVPIELNDEDFDQVQSGNFVTKVIYLPDPKYQDLAIAGVETLVSTRLDPGVDPVAEANDRGAILAVLRVGAIDLEMPHSPPLFGAPIGLTANGPNAPQGMAGRGKASTGDLDIVPSAPGQPTQQAERVGPTVR